MVVQGLGKIIPVSVAGFASLFGRIILVISEVLFLLLVTIFSKLGEKMSAKIETFISKNVIELVLGISTVIFTLYFSAISILRYDNFYAGRFDLGNMDQTVWNTVHGRFFQLSDPNGTATVSRLAFLLS